MKKFFIFFAFCLFINLYSFAQLKVKSNGFVGIATNNPIGNFQVNGSMYVTGNWNTFRFLANNPGTEIGSSCDLIEFWYTSNGYNKIKAERFIKMSDSTVKTEIEPIKDALEIINRLEGKKYNLEKNEDSTGRKDFGFLAQEVNEVLPELVWEGKDGLLGISYDGIIPILVEAVKDQQKQIQELYSLISQLNTNYSLCCDLNKSKSLIIDSANTAFLYQNSPNPFYSETKIEFYIPINSKVSSLFLYDMNGVEKKSISINQKGYGNAIIHSEELNPGMYLYTLVVDNKVVDTKTMILTKN